MEVNTNATLPSGFIEKHGENSVEEALLLVPTLNEEDAIGSVLTEAHEAGFRMILVVDGFSSDRTRLIAEQSGAIVALQEFGKGKGCGVRTGMQKFLGSRAQFLCIIDGDGTNVPSALLKLIPLVASGNADVVLGSRTRGPREKGAMDMLTLASNLTVSFLLGAKFLRLFTDVQTGYWVFNRNAVERIYPTIRSTGFEIEMELFVNAFKNGLRVSERPVGFRRRKGFTKFSFVLRLRNLYYAFRFLAS